MNEKDAWVGAGADVLAVLAFAAACVIGLIGAFVGLGVSSFWYDELYTAWVIGPGSSIAGVVDRALTDVHPPLYYISLLGFAKFAGATDEALRLFSALWATVAILLFVGATGPAFSLPARLFGAALAAGSNFWFYQAQNARFYALGFFIGTCILALSISLLKRGGREDWREVWRIALLFGFMLYGSFVHFYLMYLSLAVLIVLALLDAQRRVLMGALALTLVGLGFLYLKIIIGAHAQFEVGSSWMGGEAGWYLHQLSSARQLMLNKWGFLALAICFAAWLLRLGLQRGSVERAKAQSADTIVVSLASWQWRVDPILILVVGVPVIVVAGGIVSSIILSPNFQDRNFLTCAPFIWAAFAKLYDLGVNLLERRLRAVANIALSVVILYMSSIVVGRTLPRNTAVREAAHKIMEFQECKGQIVPVVDGTSTQWTKPGYISTITSAIFGRYLEGFALPTHLYREHLAQHKLPADMRLELQRRVDGQGCPILLWYGHRGPQSNVAISTGELLAAIDRTSAAPLVRSEFFRAYNYGIDRSLSEFGIFILFVDRKERARGG